MKNKFIKATVTAIAPVLLTAVLLFAQGRTVK